MLKHGNKSKAKHGIKFCRVPVLVMTLLLILLVLISVFHNNGEQSQSSFGSFTAESSSNFPMVEFTNGTDVIWQIPDTPKAVLFLAHGCNGRAGNFWDRSPSCPNCIGLPEERLIVHHALEKKFAVITISSMGRCWTFGEEMLIIRSIINQWLQKNKLKKLPLVALGASSGGYFVSALATILRFNSITLMIAEGLFDQIDISRNYPPTLFIHMPKDVYRQQKISDFAAILKGKGIDVGVVECAEFPLSPYLLADRIQGLDRNVSAKLFELFKDKGMIEENGYMKKDGRATQWMKALRGRKDLVLDKHLVQHVQEELNLAFAYHEMTSLQSDQIFKWFQSHLK